MELDIRELAMWYPKPLIAFEGGRVTWLNQCAAFLADGADTLARLLGEPASESLSEALKNKDAARPRACAWQADVGSSLGEGARARLIYIGGVPYIELTVAVPSKDDGAPANGVLSADDTPPATNMVSAVLSNLGELMIDPLSIMHLALLDLDDELDKYFCGLRDGPQYMLNLSPENLNDAKSLPLTLARLYRSWSRLTLLAHTQTAFSDFTGMSTDNMSADSISADNSSAGNVCDVRRFLDGLIPQVNAMLPKGTRFRLDSGDAQAPTQAQFFCGVPSAALHRVAVALMSAAVFDSRAAAADKHPAAADEHAAAADKHAATNNRAASGGAGQDREIPFILKGSGGYARLSVPVSDQRREQALNAGAFTRSSGSAADMGVWLGLTLIRRSIGKYGGSVLFTSGGGQSFLTAALPRLDRADAPWLEDETAADTSQYDRVYLSEVLDNAAFFPEWGL